MKAFTILVLVLAAAAVAAYPNPAPPDPLEAVEKLIRAYARYEGDTDVDEIDMEGTTWWYQRHFFEYSALKMKYTMTPPVVTESTRDTRRVRLSTLMCPWAPFTYSCQLEEAVIHGSASINTHSHTYSWGTTITFSMTSSIPLPIRMGPTASLSISKNWQWDDITATTTQSTNTGIQLITVDPAKGRCYELSNSMTQTTTRGQFKMMAIFTNFVGFHNHPSITWKHDSTDGPSYFRARHIWSIVKTAKEVGLPEAAAFEAVYNPNDPDMPTWYATMSNTFDIDFFLGSEGRADDKGYTNTSSECTNLLPSGWDTWLPPVGGGGARSAAQGGARRLAGHFDVRLRPDTLRVVDERGNEVAQPAGARRLQDAEPAAEPAATDAAGRQKNCPNNIAVATNDTLVLEPSALCSNSPDYDMAKKLAVQRLRDLERDNQCAITAVLAKPAKGLKRNFTLKVERRGAICRVNPTPKAELDQRDAAKRRAARAAPAAGLGLFDPPDFISKVEKLVKTLCYAETQSDCDVDTDGSSWWYKEHFSAETHARTVGWSIKASLGVITKITTPLFYTELTSTIDFAHSFSDGSSTTTTDGKSTQATVLVPLTPEMNKCCVINLVTRKASTKGTTRAWMCAEGYVGTHQDPAEKWPTLDDDGERTHYFRALPLPWVVSLAQAKNLNAGDAFDWFIDDQNRACVYNTVDISFDQGVMSVAKPILYDADSPECSKNSSSQVQLSEPGLAAATGESGELIVNATPLTKDVPCDWETCGIA
ncbi:hypothetical protein HT031_001812 [Scenedesmus sp. PABB004]|nr:hypothetical protein HT031_001812 [Scenedesmus sp. PABB004]